MYAGGEDWSGMERKREERGGGNKREVGRNERSEWKERVMKERKERGNGRE